MLGFVYAKGRNFEPTQLKSVYTGQLPHPVGNVCRGFDDVTIFNLLT